MSRIRMFLLAGSLLAALSLAAACGGDDDDTSKNDAAPTTASSSNSGNASDSKDTSPTKAASNSGGGNASSADVKYVDQMCTAVQGIMDSLDKATKDPAFAQALGADTSEQKQMEVFAKVFREPISQAVKDMEKASPPNDLKTYHQDAVKQLKNMLAAIDSKDPKKFQDFLNSSEDLVAEPPASAKARLEKAAESSDKCKKLEAALGTSLFSD